MTYREKRCTWCKTEFEQQYCIDCGVYADAYQRRCKPCATINNRKYAQSNYNAGVRRVQKLRKMFDDWLNDTINIPYKALSEEEWIRACSYFNGCAMCGADSIDARGMFIPPKHGGKYTAWNVLPVCHKCATSLKQQGNPFLRTSLGRKHEYSKAKTMYAAEYLRRQIPNEV